MSAAEATVPTRDLLAEHHARLEQACQDLLSDTYADDPRALCARWRQFEATVEEHMIAEEATILPLYEASAPDEANQIRAEHARLRALLRRLDVEVDLHEVRLATIRELIATLQAHARREQELLYPWAEQQLPRPRLAGLRARIEALLAVAQS